MNEIVNLGELTFTDVKMNPCNWKIAVLPWGAIEPHGEHLPYLTDSMLATMVSYHAIVKLNSQKETKNMFMALPCMSIGLQNLGQVDKKYCINFSYLTQFRVLEDIVTSLEKQGINKLVIINGHNGNDFKPIVRELATKHEGFKIFVCNYLDLVDDYLKTNEQQSINFPKVDDHAAFTETSLLLYYVGEVVNKKYMENAKDIENSEIELQDRHKPLDFWTPRNFDDVSINNRIGEIGDASVENGKKIAEFLEDMIATNLTIISKLS